MSDRKANPMLFDHVKMASRQLFASRYELCLPSEEELRKAPERERALVVRKQRARYGEENDDAIL